MLHSTFNSNAYQQFCSEIQVLRNGDSDKWILYDCLSGDVYPKTFNSKEEAEKAREEMYNR